MDKKQHLSGLVNIARYLNDVGEKVRITIEDQSSGIGCVEFRMTAEEFGDLLLGFSATCRFVLRPQLVGSKHENKTEFIEFTATDHKAAKAEAIAAVKPYEVDGWSARVGDLTNQHCRAVVGGKKGYNVAFHRWVDDQGNPVS